MGLPSLEVSFALALIFLIARTIAVLQAENDDGLDAHQSSTYKAGTKGSRINAQRLWEEKRDSAHAALWRQLGGRAIVAEDSAAIMGAPPEELTVLANGRELKLDADHRDGKVNSIMLTVSARWKHFSEHPDTKLNISLSDSTSHRYGAFAEGKTTNVGCEVKKLDGGILVHFGENPNHQQMTLTFKYGTREHKWNVETSDQSSGDAQAEIMFRHEKFDGKALKDEFGDEARHHMGSESDILIAKELTIFDLDSRPTTPTLEANGFEVDSSFSLREPLANFMSDILDDPQPNKRFRLEFNVIDVREVYISSAAALRNLGGAINQGSSGWTFTKAFQVETGGFENENLGMGEVIVQFEHKCTKIQSKFGSCDPEPVNFTTDLVPPVKLSILKKHTRHVRQTTRALLMLVGAEFALAPPNMRRDVLKRFLPHGVPLKSAIFRYGGDVNDVVGIVEKAANLAEKLLEAMEQKSINWWKMKTNTTADIKSACFSMLFRHTRAGMQGLPIAHVDATSVGQWFREGGAYPAVSQHRTEKKLGMKLSEALKHVVATINEWVNADEKPIVELPLAMMDTKTLAMSDLDLHWLQASHILESMALRWSDTQKWWYKSLGQAEGYIFATSPHEGPRGMRFTGTPHSAFKFKRSVSSAGAQRERQSVELRCLLVDEAWVHQTASMTAEEGASMPGMSEPAISKMLGQHIMSLMVQGVSNNEDIPGPEGD